MKGVRASSRLRLRKVQRRRRRRRQSCRMPLKGKLGRARKLQCDMTCASSPFTKRNYGDRQSRLQRCANSYDKQAISDICTALLHTTCMCVAHTVIRYRGSEASDCAASSTTLPGVNVTFRGVGIYEVFRREHHSRMQRWPRLASSSQEARNFLCAAQPRAECLTGNLSPTQRSIPSCQHKAK